MAETNNPMTASDDTTITAAVSKTTLPIAGLHVDVYGLTELSDAVTTVSCLWLHHPRLRRKEDMGYIAEQMITASYNHENAPRIAATRGLIAVAFDQRNHGSRLVSDTSNGSWRDGNQTHAQDMFGMVSGTVADTTHLIDLIEGYLFNDGRRIDSNLVLGVSLGGHSAWQLLFADPRVTAGVIVIGCPDYMNVMQDRARLSKLQTFKVDKGATFLGSKDFPAGLVEACKKYDPKGILFGTGEVANRTEPLSSTEQDRLRTLLDARVRGKRFQVLSGGADKLVPYNASRPFLDFFKKAAFSWYKDGNVYVEDRVYEGAGHQFNEEMRTDAVWFIIDILRSLDAPRSQAPPKI